MTAKRSNIPFILLAIAAAALSATAGFSLWQLNQARQQAALAALVVLPEPRVLGDFSLVDQHGEPFSIERLRDRWSLLFFGFTYCPDICPSTLYDLRQVSDSLAGGGASEAGPQVVFVSVDPERDSPKRLGEYVSWFGPDFVAVTGPPEELSRLAVRIGVAYRIEEHAPGSQDYLVNHSASVFLTDPQGRLHGVFPAPVEAGAMAHDLAALFE